jgi:hypothetical protein
LCPFLTTTVLFLALLGLTAKACVPAIDDDVTFLVSLDPGGATTNDSDDDGNPTPDAHSSTCKFGDFANAILLPVDVVLPHTLMPVHALAVCDAATEPLLPRHFLPNAETGPPADNANGVTTASCAVWLLGLVGTVTRSGRFPRFSASDPQQHSPSSITWEFSL